jgi:hypothetical protein
MVFFRDRKRTAGFVFMMHSRFLPVAGVVAAWFMAAVPAGAVPEFFSFFNSKEPLPAQLPSVPAEVAGLLEMERVLNRIRLGEKPEVWRPLLERYQTFQGEKGVGAGLRDLALAWEARARMQEWDPVLRAAYRKKVRFPDSLEALLPTVAESLRTDPWGEGWGYALTAPAHSPQLVGQRYALFPKRFPKLTPLAVAVKTAPLLPQATIRLSSAAGVMSLEVSSPALQPSRSFKLVGDHFGSYRVMWLATAGVILCNEDGFLALGFQQAAK